MGRPSRWFGSLRRLRPTDSAGNDRAPGAATCQQQCKPVLRGTPERCLLCAVRRMGSLDNLLHDKSNVKKKQNGDYGCDIVGWTDRATPGTPPLCAVTCPPPTKHPIIVPCVLLPARPKPSIPSLLALLTPCYADTGQDPVMERP